MPGLVVLVMIVDFWVFCCFELIVDCSLVCFARGIAVGWCLVVRLWLGGWVVLGFGDLLFVCLVVFSFLSGLFGVGLRNMVSVGGLGC